MALAAVLPFVLINRLVDQRAPPPYLSLLARSFIAYGCSIQGVMVCFSSVLQGHLLPSNIDDI